MSYSYAPYIPVTNSISSLYDNTINYANGSITFTGNVASGNTNLTGGVYTTVPTTLSNGANMPASFVSDKFVQAIQPIQDQALSVRERMNQREMSGAELHPLLKTVIDEANLLEKQKKELTIEIENLRSASASTTSDSEKVKELERKIANQTATLHDLQTAHEELLKAHGDLRQIIRDYSEDAVDQIVSDYEEQIEAYEADLTYYENLVEDFKNKRNESMALVSTFKDTDRFTDGQTEEIVAAFRRDLAAIRDPAKREEILKKMNSPVGGLSQEQVDALIAKAKLEAKAEGKLELLAQQDAEISHEDKMINIGPGAKVWQTSTERGPFWTQTPKTFRHKDKEKSTSPGWLVHNQKGKEEHYPVGDLTDKAPISTAKPNKLKLMLVGCVNAVGTQLIAVQAFGPKAIIPMAIAQTIIGAITYWELSKR